MRTLFNSLAIRLLFGAALCGSVGTSTLVAAEYGPDDAMISYEGRTLRTPDHRVRLGFPGIVMRLRATATELQLKMNASSDDVYFNVSVDAANPRVLRVMKGETTVTLYERAPAGVHTVEMVRRTESWQGTCDIVRVIASGGALQPVPSLPARKLLFVGDSVTCGASTDRERSGAARSNPAASYAMLLTRKLGAQCQLVSYGGKGVIRDWRGDRTEVTAPRFYELSLPDEPGARWDHASWVPDAIGVALGTNDFNRGIPDENEFVNAYVEFVRKLQRDAPNAPIFLIDSPILDDNEGEGPKGAALRAYLDRIVAKVGSARVTHARTKHYLGSDGDGHPTAAEHVAIAGELEGAFRTALGW